MQGDRERDGWYEVVHITLPSVLNALCPDENGFSFLYIAHCEY